MTYERPIPRPAKQTPAAMVHYWLVCVQQNYLSQLQEDEQVRVTVRAPRGEELTVVSVAPLDDLEGHILVVEAAEEDAPQERSGMRLLFMEATAVDFKFTTVKKGSTRQRRFQGLQPLR